jgi:hypothetical protein
LDSFSSKADGVRIGRRQMVRHAGHGGVHLPTACSIGSALAHRTSYKVPRLLFWNLTEGFFIHNLASRGFDQRWTSQEDPSLILLRDPAQRCPHIGSNPIRDDPLAVTMMTTSDIAGMYAPPATDIPWTTLICGIPRPDILAML